MFKNMNLQARPGQLIQIRGKNGSGKSSLLKILIGLLKPDTGSVLWNNEDIKNLSTSYHKQLLYIGHKPAIKSDLSVIQNLRLLSGLHNQDFDSAHLEQTLERLTLKNHCHIPAGYLSKGQQKRIVLSRLWLQIRPLLVLDEPYSSLDEQAVGALNKRIQELLQKQAIIIITSHQQVLPHGVASLEIRLGL